MQHNGLFINGDWCWDKYNILKATDKDGRTIDTIAELKLDTTDSTTRSATKRLIAHAPEMYSLLDTLLRNLKYSNLSRNARRDVHDMLSDIDYRAFTYPSKKLIAYAPAMLDLVKSVSEIHDDSDVEKIIGIQKEAAMLIEKIGDD